MSSTGDGDSDRLEHSHSHCACTNQPASGRIPSAGASPQFRRDSTPRPISTAERITAVNDIEAILSESSLLRSHRRQWNRWPTPHRILNSLVLGSSVLGSRRRIIIRSCQSRRSKQYALENPRLIIDTQRRQSRNRRLPRRDFKGSVDTIRAVYWLVLGLHANDA